MALTAYSGTNVPLPDLHANRDYSSIGSISATDATGIVIDMQKFIGLLVQGTPNGFSGSVIFSGSIDGSTYVVLETLTDPLDSFVRTFQFPFNYYKITGTWSAGNVSLIAARAPYLMAGTGGYVRLGP